MSKRPRRNHAPAFKAKLALAAIKGDRTLADAPLIDAEILFRQPGPPLTFASNSLRNETFLTSYHRTAISSKRGASWPMTGRISGRKSTPPR
jgi:hypothetical protein